MGNFMKSCKEINFLPKKKENGEPLPIKPPFDPNPVSIQEPVPQKSTVSIDLPDDHIEEFNEKDGYFDPAECEYFTKYYQTEECIKKSLKSRKIRWKEGEPIGHGSFGRVILGFNKETGELMAVKQVHLIGFNTSIERVKAMEAEFNLLSQLKHKNIVRYIGTSKSHETFNIFLEYVSGGSISSLINKFGKFNENLIRIYTTQILEGLEYLHWNKVLHRDIKGANVLVDNDGVCKLADFGSAKKICGIYEDERFQSLSGTAYWMAPEVIKQKGYGRFADIWSVGCTILEMATGNPPCAMLHIAQGDCIPAFPEDIAPVTRNFLELCFKLVPHERLNVHKLRKHSFITGAVNLQKPLPVLDITKEKEDKILEKCEGNNFENESKESIEKASDLNSENNKSNEQFLKNKQQKVRDNKCKEIIESNNEKSRSDSSENSSKRDISYTIRSNDSVSGCKNEKNISENKSILRFNSSGFQTNNVVLNII